MKRNITVTLDKAREWFNSGNATLKEVALQAFNEDELVYSFNDITTFYKACEALNLSYSSMLGIASSIATISKASAAMFQLNIIRKALNLGQDLHLTKNTKNSDIYYPRNPFATESSVHYEGGIDTGKMQVIGKIKNDGILYNVLGGNTHTCGGEGLGLFHSCCGVGFADADLGFLGCATKEIAQHFSKYFGMLITEAKYGDMADFEVIGNIHDTERKV